MDAQTIFFITGSAFFTASVLILLVIAAYCIKVLRQISKIESELKSTLAGIKNKVTSFSLGFAGFAALLEKLIDLKQNSKKPHGDRQEDNSDDDEPGEPAKPGKAKKIKVVQADI